MNTTNENQTPEAKPRKGWRLTKAFHFGESGERDEFRPSTTQSHSYSGHEGQKFRLLDDDRVVMAYGHYAGRPDHESPIFAPLDDFGEGAYGCTILEWYEQGKWTTI